MSGGLGRLREVARRGCRAISFHRGTRRARVDLNRSCDDAESRTSDTPGAEDRIDDPERSGEDRTRRARTTGTRVASQSGWMESIENQRERGPRGSVVSNLPVGRASSKGDF